MRYTVAHNGVPIGTAELPDRELTSGLLDPAKGYASVRDVVRRGSEVLLSMGVFGAAVNSSPDPTKMSQTALNKAAALRFDLADEYGRSIPVDFVNLIEHPDSGVILVIARLRSAPALVSARLPSTRAADANEQNR